MTKIEEVARALALRGSLDAWGNLFDAWGNLSVERRKYWMDMAKAAIEAMREPTDDMRVAGWERISSYCEDVSGGALGFAWNDMISAALKEQP